MYPQPTVLVVDDDEDILAAFEDFFRREQCTMLAAQSADEALALLRSEHVDLLVTDIRLKVQSGVTLFMKAKMEQEGLPVIVITGFADLLSEHDLKAYGADFYFVKPLELDKFRGAVRSCLLRGDRT
jgi:DNA-binding NtrC family response regulator